MTVPNLYAVVLRVLEAGVERMLKEGVITTIPTELWGEVEITKAGEEVTFVFNGQGGRRFVLGADRVLVEKISLTTFTPPPSPPTTCEQYLKEWVRTFNYPDREEGTRKMLYGEGEDEKVCLLTRTDKGLLADFLTEELKLFYDLGFRVIRRYVDYKPKRKKRKKRTLEQVKRTANKKYRSIYGTDAQWAKQKDAYGNEERVDRRFFSVPIRCMEEGCEEVRWIKPSDTHQVRRCKQCQRKFKNRR